MTTASAGTHVEGVSPVPAQMWAMRRRCVRGELARAAAAAFTRARRWWCVQALRAHARLFTAHACTTCPQAANGRVRADMNEFLRAGMAAHKSAPRHKQATALCLCASAQRYARGGHYELTSGSGVVNWQRRACRSGAVAQD